MVEPTHRSTDETRAGTTPHVTRYVLAISFTLVVIVLGLVLVWGDASFDKRTGDAREAPVSADRSGSLDTPPSAVTPGTARAPTTDATPSAPMVPATDTARSAEGTSE